MPASTLALTTRIASAACMFGVLLGCNNTPQALDSAEQPWVGATGLRVETVVDGLDDPWGMDFLPDGRLLVTQKSGSLLLINLASETHAEVKHVPAVAEVGQGGLLDVLVHTEDGTRWIYLSYVIAQGEGYTTRVARAQMENRRLKNLQVLFTAQPAYPTKRHFGSRLYIDADNYLFFGVGDRGRRSGPQDLSVHNGKMMRLHSDGRIPRDNPFVATPGALAAIWSYGHRNPQGLAAHPDSGELWISEHGPQGGDEINRLRRGANYGWPVITYGEEYGGGKIGEGSRREGMEQPLKYYVPSIATAGIDFYSSGAYPDWSPSLLVAALRQTHLNRVELSAAGLGREWRILADLKMRIRDVQVGPDGYVYLLAGGDRLLRLVAEQ